MDVAADTFNNYGLSRPMHLGLHGRSIIETRLCNIAVHVRSDRLV